jgi:drug/metabolite transporter (DMT)-like permease
MRRAYVFILLASAIFSTMEIAGRTLARDLNPLQINFWRFLVASLVLLPMTVRSLRKRGIRLDRRSAVYFLSAGLIGIVLSMAFFQMALAHTKASTVAVIVSSNPVVIIPFACLFLKEEFNRNTALSLFFCAAGIICILNPLEMNPEATGIALAIGSTVTFALYSVIGKNGTRRYGSVPFTCLTFLAGTSTMFVLIALSNVVSAGHITNEFVSPFLNIPLIQGIGWKHILILLYISVVGTSLGFILFFQAIEETSASTGSVTFFIKPALAPILAFFILGERIPTSTLLGIGLIILGTYFVFVRRDAGQPLLAPAVDLATADEPRSDVALTCREGNFFDA